MQGGILDRQRRVVADYTQTQPPRPCRERLTCSHGQPAGQQQPCRCCRARDGSGSHLACLKDGRPAVT